MNKVKLSYFILILFFSGCASTGVIPMGQDSYYIAKKDGSPGLGVSFSNKVEVYQEANIFCEKKRLEVSILRETVTASALGRLGSTELYFKCVQLGATSKPLQKEEVRQY